MIPDAKILIFLRNPIDRAFSHYLMDRRLGLVKCNFSDVISGACTCKNSNLYYQQYIELGMYNDQVERYMNVFGPNKVQVHLFEDLTNNPTNVIHEILRFLGVSTKIELPINEAKNVYANPKNGLYKRLYATRWVRKLARKVLPTQTVEYIRAKVLVRDKKPRLAVSERQRLAQIYRDDINKLEKTVGRSLKKWQI